MSQVPGKYRGSKAYLLVYCELLRAARYKGLVTYQEIAEIMGLPLSGSHIGREVGRILGEISEDEHRVGRPMLSALAVGTDGKPGQGFFALARDLERLTGDSGQDEMGFWKQEQAAVYETWKKTLGH